MACPEASDQCLASSVRRGALLIIKTMGDVFPRVSVGNSRPRVGQLLGDGGMSSRRTVVPALRVTGASLGTLPNKRGRVLVLVATGLLYTTRGRCVCRDVGARVSYRKRLFATSKGGILRCK